MNTAVDYNGFLVSSSKPVKELRTVKRTFLIDSGDRDFNKYPTNGDAVYMLPRTYENVVSIRLKSATFPRLVSESSSAGGLIHSYSNGKVYTADTPLGLPAPNYFLVELEGLNKFDETCVNAQGSTYVDSYYARIVNTLSNASSSLSIIQYSDNTFGDNTTHYYPAIGRLDRLHIITRLHQQQGSNGFIYWTRDGTTSAGSSEYSLEFEIETLDNGFDDFSSIASRITNRA
jgi:hypothetical protein